MSGLEAGFTPCVLGQHRPMPLTWARIARPPFGLGEQRRTPVLRQLTTASSGWSLGESPCLKSREHTQEPEHRPRLSARLLEKPRSPVGGGAVGLEMVTTSLLDMGFSDAHVGELLSIQPAPSPQQLLTLTAELILLGVNPGPVCVILKKSPQLLKLPAKQVKKRSSYLRKLGLCEGKLKRLLYCCPEIFTLNQRELDVIIRVLGEKCLFTVQQVTEVLSRCPYILLGDPDELEYKFQYAYFRMGIKHSDVVRTDFLQYSLTKIKQRHMYLERLGRYQTPDKKGQTQLPNPFLKDIFRVSEAEFLAKTARSSVEEFEVFKKLLAREEEEAPHSGRSEADRSASSDNDAEEELTDEGD
ncbi:PREDICTED: mTERF domain-containing protein 2 [Chrysochloris asiatica]|uniref:Transcription termination factor 4, mitochondrial n=1 Tax=Chrysochloris asiatica TaxID=185453 RepID=A0A9B0U3L4_CHRAS|nr:PREDICTED: mTERF domain-containing protein 2 [Chrysochloris asiatica]